MALNDLLIGDYISDLLTIFVALHKECTKQLLSLPLHPRLTDADVAHVARQVSAFVKGSLPA